MRIFFPCVSLSTNDFVREEQNTTTAFSIFSRRPLAVSISPISSIDSAQETAREKADFPSKSASDWCEFSFSAKRTVRFFTFVIIGFSQKEFTQEFTRDEETAKLPQPRRTCFLPFGVFQKPHRTCFLPFGVFQKPHRNYFLPFGVFQKPRRNYFLPFGVFQKPHRTCFLSFGVFPKPHRTCFLQSGFKIKKNRKKRRYSFRQIVQHLKKRYSVNFDFGIW